MPTHYDVLGIAPTAPAAEVRRAYLDLARELHPDRVQGGTGADADRTSRRMQEVNEAWRVLREPASRAAYDQALITRTPRATPSPPPRHLADGDDLDTPFRSAPAEPGDIGVSVVRALPWVVMLVVLGTIFVFTAFAGGDDTPRRADQLVGRCVSSGPGGRTAAAVAVPCQGPNDGEVVLVVDRAARCPDDSTSRPMQDRYLCLRPFDDVPDANSEGVE